VASSLVSRLTRIAGWRRRPARPRRLAGTLAESLTGANQPHGVLAWRAARGPVLYPRPSEDALRLYREREPAACALTLGRGEELLRHRFDLLGSGVVTVADPHRPARSDGYQPIDWHLDARSGARFRHDVAPQDWGPAQVPAGSDVKWPWELGRCQHWPVLAQCYLLSGDSRFAREIAAELEDFADGVTLGRGVQWVCAMDVAIRAVNWALAFEWIRDAPGMDEGFWSRALELLFAHGCFVADHLENGYEVTSNHYLSDLAGLLFLGRVFAPLRQGREWESFARRELEKEIRVQVLPDGADYESSVPYHRLVAELLLASARIMDLAGEPAPRGFKTTLLKMLEFQAAVLRPDGRLPVFGDADDGRLHILEGYGDGAPNAGRHQLGPGRFVLDAPQFLAAAASEGRREAFWWGFPEALESPDAIGEPRAEGRLFSQAGLAVHRDRGDFLLVSNGRVGTAGFGNHKHNDQLSFELHLAGQPLVVDPGSYVYTSDPAARNQFRGTGFHNTLSVDDGEQNELNPAWLFRLQERARPEHLAWQLTDGHFEYRGRHHGFEPVVHERWLRLLRGKRTLVVVDRVRGEGTRRLRWHLHFAPGVKLTEGDDGELRLDVASQRYRLRREGLRRARLGSSWCSPSYGVRVACAVADFEETVELRGEIVRAFAILPDPAELSLDELAGEMASMGHPEPRTS
jgi:hypothetical protein